MLFINISYDDMHWGNKPVDDVESPEIEHRQTLFIWLDTRQKRAKIQFQTITLRETSIHISTEVKCLGVIIDSELTFALHIKRLTGRCFYQLRQLRSIRRSLNTDATKTLVTAFITSRVYYYSSVFNGTGAVHIRPIQSVRLIVKNRKYDQITATIRNEMYWLPVQQRIDHKLCNFIYKCLHQSAPSYTSSVCIRVCEIEGRRHLRSARGDLVVPRTNNKTHGPRSFAVAGQSVWNSLPSAARDFD